MPTTYTCPRCGEEDDVEREVFHDGEVLGEDEEIECGCCGALLLVDVDVDITLTARIDEDGEADRAREDADEGARTAREIAAESIR